MWPACSDSGMREDNIPRIPAPRASIRATPEDPEIHAHTTDLSPAHAAQVIFLYLMKIRIYGQQGDLSGFREFLRKQKNYRDFWCETGRVMAAEAVKVTRPFQEVFGL